MTLHPKACRHASCGWHSEYAIEAALLGGFMVSALAFTLWLEHPASPLRAALPSALVRRLIAGAGMGATAIVLIYSGWGQRSGAHMNPAVTLAFARLGLVSRSTAAGYMAGQFIGGLVGVGLARALFGPALQHASVQFAVTTPAWGAALAFWAEVAMTASLMGAVLATSRADAWRPYAGMVAAGCVAAFVAVEAPVSGMSLNPARTLASAVWAGEYTGLWIYFLAPALGMLLAAEAAQHVHLPSKDSACSTTT